MLRDFLKEGTIYTLANLATKGVSLLLIPFYTAYFSPADYGVLDILVVFSGFVNAIISLQIGQGVGRYLADEKLSELQRQKIGSTGINLIIILYTLATIILWLTASFWTEKLSAGDEISDSIFKLAISTIGINALFYQLGIHLRFKRETKIFAITNFLHAILNILLTFVFVSQYQFGIDAIYYSSILVAPFIVIFQLIYVKKDYLFFLGKEQTRLLLKFSIPLIPAALAYTVLELTDRFFISHIDTLNEVGIYGIGSKFSSVIYLVITGFSMALAPIIYENHTLDSTRQKLRKLIRFYFLAGSVSILILALFSHETLVVFTNEKFYSASGVMPFLYVAVFFTGIGMFSVGVHLSGKTYLSSIIVIFSALVNVLLNWLLIPHYGFVGAGVSTAISMWINHICFYMISAQYYYFFPSSRVILNASILLMLAFGIVFIEKLQIDYPILLTLKILVSVIALSVTFVLYKKLRKSA